MSVEERRAKVIVNNGQYKRLDQQIHGVQIAEYKVKKKCMKCWQVRSQSFYYHTLSQLSWVAIMTGALFCEI